MASCAFACRPITCQPALLLPLTLPLPLAPPLLLMKFAAAPPSPPPTRRPSAAAAAAQHKHGTVVNSSEKYVDHSPTAARALSFHLPSLLFSLSHSLPAAVIHSLLLATILAPHGIGKGYKSEGNMGHDGRRTDRERERERKE